MPPKKAPAKRRSTDSGVERDRGALSQEKKDQRIALFLSDFDQQAKESIREMKKELDLLLQMAEKAFMVELLKMPTAIRKMKRKDLLNLQEGEEVALAAAATDCTLEDVPNPKVTRTNSKKVKVTTIVEYEDAKYTSAKKIPKKVSKSKSLVSLSSGLNSKLHSLSRSVYSSTSINEAVKTLAPDCNATNFKATPKVSKGAGLQQAVSRTLPTSERVQGMILRSKSVPQDKMVPFVNIPLADGQTLRMAGGDLRNFDVQLLNQDTVQHIHNLVSELTVLCGKATAKSS
ncbi:borealin-2 isoform X1 [Centrocercus urophasianus]|uniref:borealin-2 n=1 Tax=Tympanuchus pallidicinctus TaxID=109042 RepID=UPI001C6455F5|nr:borealin-2 isoform X1 [Centrocercus urophasianus]XP_052541579.1 borealin-2 [Tympanuchus pallidicinctus]